jgi:hypothetical protein
VNLSIKNMYVVLRVGCQVEQASFYMYLNGKGTSPAQRQRPSAAMYYGDCQVELVG